MYDEFILEIQESRPNNYFKNSERHHIIPRCLGGTDDEENLIYLTYREHFIAHKLLSEENPENDSLTYAYWRMCNRTDEIILPEDYEAAKFRFIEMHSKKMKGNQNSLGYKFTEEQREHLSKALTGKSKSEATRKKMSKSLIGNQRWLGKHHTEETKEKIAEANKGRVLSEETRRKISEGWDYSTHVTEESRRKQSIARKGKKRPPMVYHVSCMYCDKEFIGTGARSRVCDDCKLERSR